MCQSPDNIPVTLNNIKKQVVVDLNLNSAYDYI